MPTIDEIEICNNALSLCGQGSHISSLEEESKEAKTCKRLFMRAVERCVDKFDWSFCRKDEVITEDYLLKDVASPPFHFSYKLPEDCLRVVTVHNTELDAWYARQVNGRQTIGFDYRNYKGQKILVTDVEVPFVLEYQALITDVNLFPPTFIEALEYTLAGVLAIEFVKGTTGAELGLQLEKQGYAILKQAWTLDSHIGEEPIEDLSVNSLLASRGGYRRDY